MDRAQELAASLRKSQVPQFKDTLGGVAYRQTDFKSAVTLLQDAATVLPDIALVHYHLGMSYLATGQNAKAAEQFKAALAKSPTPELASTIQDGLKKSMTQ